MFKIEAHGELSYIRNREHPQDVICPSCSRPPGPGRWGNANFAITQFSEVRELGILRSSGHHIDI